MKKIMSVLLTLAMLVGLMPVMAVNAAWDGNSASSLTVQDGVYLISNAAELKKANELITANANGEAAASYKLTANIDYANHEWTPINISGTFDGNGYAIKNVKISKNQGSNAFFGDCTATIKNLGLENMNIVLNSADNKNVMYTAPFIFRSGGKVLNCYVKNSTVKCNTGGWSAWSVGGFSGSAWKNATFENCYVYNVQLSGVSNTTGGFDGKLDGAATFKNCYVAELTSSIANTDGFGHIDGDSVTLENCYTTFTTTDDVTDSMGATFGTKDSIIQAMVTSGKTDAYRKSELFNNGYPSLTWEKWPKATKLRGEGTKESPYLIGTAPELQLASEMVNADTASTGAAKASYKLTANIDFENGEWVPIACANSFYGTFDGDNHTVKNLKITNSNLANFGFFGTTEQNAVIQNLGIENININKYKYICSVCRGQ